MDIQGFRSLQRRNLQVFRKQPLAEISGSLGDLGTFLPIVIALTLTHSISLPSTLVFSGLFNILTGFFFGIPLPVQPMKAIAAVAIANDFSNGSIAAAGIFVAGVILFFSVTGLLRWFNSVIPVPVVKGIQVGAGFSLIISSGSKLVGDLSWVGPSWADNLIWAIAAFLFLLLSGIIPRVPYALIVLVVGLVLAGISISTSGAVSPRFAIWHPQTVHFRAVDWRIGILDAGLGQLPLTTLNSIIAVVALAGDLLPSVTTPTVTSIGLSVAAMNLIGCWFRAMPVCHGSGGLAAQYRFGARSGASIIFLGLVKLIIGIFFGDGIFDLLRKFPRSLLGIMVIAAGLELAAVGESLNTPGARDLTSSDDEPQEVMIMDKDGHAEQSLTEQERKRRWYVMLVTIAGIVAFKNDAVGFLAGMLCHWSFRLPILWDKLAQRHSMLPSRRDGERDAADREQLLPHDERDTA